MRLRVSEGFLSLFILSSIACARGDRPPSGPTPHVAAEPALAPPLADDPNDVADPTESAGPIAMQIVFPESPIFPATKVADAECWKGVELSGDHEIDYATLVARCGAPTGLLEYARSIEGRLHAEHDRHDTFSVRLKGGLCYRYFAVADAIIDDLDLVVLTSDGALVATETAKGPVAIVDAARTWCQTEDTELRFVVSVGGSGKGGYRFGVFARTK